MTPTEIFKALGFEGDDLKRLTCHEDSYCEFLAKCMKQVFKLGMEEYDKEIKIATGKG